MKRRTLVKGSAWAVPAVMLAAAAPAVAASAPPVAIGEGCKIPSQRVASDYRLVITGLTGTTNVVSAKIKGVSASFTPSILTPSNNIITVSTLPNADSQIDFEIVTDKGIIRQAVKVLPCKD